MTQWEVFLAFTAIVAFCITIFKASAFINNLNSTMETLNANVKMLGNEVKEIARANHDGRKRLWEHNEEQDEQLHDHETRIQLIEKKKGREE